MKSTLAQTKARKAPRPPRVRRGAKPSHEKLEAIFAEVDGAFGGRDTGAVDFLIKLRRGEI